MKEENPLESIENVEVEPLTDGDLESVAGGSAGGTGTCPSTSTCPSGGCPTTNTCPPTTELSAE